MKVETEEVYYIARLARLDLTEEEAHRVSEKLSVILEYMSSLESLESESDELIGNFKNQNNILRNDNIHKRISHKAALSQSQDSASDYFRVPKVIS